MSSAGETRLKVANALSGAGLAQRVEAYFFGSWLTSFQSADDIDVLVVYADETACSEARAVLEAVQLPKPLDLQLFTFEEEAGYDFISRSGAERATL